MSNENNFEFDESDQAAIFALIKLPDSWYDNRPMDEKLGKPMLLVPKGDGSDNPIKISYEPNKKQ